MPYVSAPSDIARDHAAKRLAALATPPGALGRLGELGIWLASCQGHVPPKPVNDVRLVIFAGDHGVASHGVSAFPPAITGAMVRTFLAGKAAVNALAATHGVAVRVLDLGVDDDFADLDEATRAALTVPGSAEGWSPGGGGGPRNGRRPVPCGRGCTLACPPRAPRPGLGRCGARRRDTARGRRGERRHRDRPQGRAASLRTRRELRAGSGATAPRAPSR